MITLTGLQDQQDYRGMRRCWGEAAGRRVSSARALTCRIIPSGWISIKRSYSIHALLLTISVVPMGLVTTPLRDTGTEAAI